MNIQRFILLAFVINAYFIVTFSLATGNDHVQHQTQGEIQTLPFQRSHNIQIFPGVTKKLQLNIQQLANYITHNNELKIMKSFTLQYESILRTAQIYISVFSNKTENDKDKPTVFDLNQNLALQQSKVFYLTFLQKFNLNDIQKIQLDIRSKTFSVIALTLMNNQIADEINLHNEKSQGFGRISVWMPNSYDSETDNTQQITKYLYFKASQNPTKLRINRIKGHPKIFLYNCESNKISFCRQQIDEQHIQGTLMLQKQLQITLEKEPKCKNCYIIVAIKNMGAQTKMQISEHKVHDSLILSKDNPTYFNLKAKQTLEVTSYFNVLEKFDSNPYFLDVSVIDENSNSLIMQFVSIKSIGVSNNQQKNIQIHQLSTFFKTQNQSKAIKVKLDPSLELSKYLSEKDSNNQTWYKINVKLTAHKTTQFSIVDRNVPLDQENFISLKDGQIFHSYLFSQHQLLSKQLKLSETISQNFKVKVSSISVLAVTSLCSQINKMTISYYPQTINSTNRIQTLTKISPKVFVENITHYNKKCSQLIHLNPLQLFNDKVNDNNGQKSGWVYFRISGVKTEVDLLYSSSDIITLEKSFPYHSQLQYNHELYFHVPNVRNQTRIKIQKCSDCQINLSFSQQQLADIKAQRSHRIIEKELKQINSLYMYQMKAQNGLFVKVSTNNFAHFAIIVQEINEKESQLLNVYGPLQLKNKISFSLQENNTLTLEFPPPTFLYTNNLNSPTHFSLVQGSINVQVSRQTYCPELIFSEKERTRDISITQIMPRLINDDQGNEKFTFSMQVKHHDFFGIRAQKGDEIFSYKVVNIESMKTYSTYRWSIFHVALFLTFAIFMSFVCFMGLKKNRIKKVGGQVVMQSQDVEQTSMIRLN